MRFAALLLLAAALAGCATATVSREGVTMVDIANTGWYLLDFIPLASGNPDAPNGCSCRLFRNSVTLENNIKILDHVMRDEGMDGVRDLSSFTTDEHVFILLFKRHTYHTSARLTKTDGPAAQSPDGKSAE